MILFLFLLTRRKADNVVDSDKKVSVHSRDTNEGRKKTMS